MDKKNYATDILTYLQLCNRSSSRQTKELGYIGLAYETKEVKQLASYDQGKTLLSHL
jgi:hypothetical protein